MKTVTECQVDGTTCRCHQTQMYVTYVCVCVCMRHWSDSLPAVVQSLVLQVVSPRSWYEPTGRRAAQPDTHTHTMTDTHRHTDRQTYLLTDATECITNATATATTGIMLCQYNTVQKRTIHSSNVSVCVTGTWDSAVTDAAEPSDVVVVELLAGNLDESLSSASVNDDCSRTHFSSLCITNTHTHTRCHRRVSINTALLSSILAAISFSVRC